MTPRKRCSQAGRLMPWREEVEEGGTGTEEVTLTAPPTAAASAAPAAASLVTCAEGDEGAADSREAARIMRRRESTWTRDWRCLQCNGTGGGGREEGTR